MSIQSTPLLSAALLHQCKLTRSFPSQIFKIVLSKAFDLKCTIPEIENVGEPLLLYQSC